jgi:hypothetical protein
MMHLHLRTYRRLQWMERSSSNKQRSLCARLTERATLLSYYYLVLLLPCTTSDG